MIGPPWRIWEVEKWDVWKERGFRRQGDIERDVNDVRPREVAMVEKDGFKKIKHFDWDCECHSRWRWLPSSRSQPGTPIRV